MFKVSISLDMNRIISKISHFIKKDVALSLSYYFSNTDQRFYQRSACEVCLS